jgi:hypothetical protein
MPDIITSEEMHPHLRHADWLGWAVCTLLGDKKFDAASVFPMTFDVRINGVEVSFKALVEEMQKQYDEQVRLHAVDLLKEKIGSIHGALSSLEVEVEGLVNDARSRTTLEPAAPPPLRLYVWENVMRDYGPGLTFALAHDSEEARSLIGAKLGAHVPSTYLGESPRVVTEAEGFGAHGGS